MADRPLVLTPEFLRDRATEINVSIVQFNDDLIQQKKAGKLADDAPKLKAWRAFRDRWLQWYAGTDWWTWAWGATNAALDAYTSQMHDWVKWYSRAFAVPPTGAPPTSYTPDDRDGTSNALLIGLAAAGITATLIAIFKR